MRPSKTFCLLAASILLADSAAAAETNAAGASDTNRLPFDVASKQELVQGLPPATRVYITNGTETFALLTPAGYRLDSSAQTGIQLVNETYDSFMTFRIIEGQQDDKANPGSAYYRGLLANRYPNVKVLEEFHEEAGGMSGVAFDFHWLSQGNTVRASRAVFIPSRGGVLEFSLICSPDRFQQVRYDFNFLLLTFRASKDGKLEVTPRSSLF